MPTTYKLATVNNAPEKAKPLFAKITADLGDRYEIIPVGNAEDPKDVKKIVEETKPDVLFIASMWTDEQASQAVADAKSVNPSIKHLALPHGLQAEKGPEAVIAYINEHLPKVLDG